MHRSGTSLATGLIRLMGAYVGPDKLLLPANKANEKGFWERKDVMQINELLLAQQGCNWQSVDSWHEDNPPMAPEIRAAMQIVLADSNAHAPWVMKDPRLCITLPCWLPLLDSPIAVIASRHPLAVAHSLQLRNGIPIEYGLALWESYAIHLLRHAAGLPKVFCRYEALLEDPVVETRKLCGALAKHAPALCLPAETVITDFITPALQRAHPDGKTTLTPRQQRLYTILCGETDWKADIDF